MRRRTFIAGLASAAARPVVARAQQVERVRRVGVLMNFAATQTRETSSATAFIERLRELKWVEGQIYNPIFAGMPVTLSSRASMRHN